MFGNEVVSEHDELEESDVGKRCEGGEKVEGGQPPGKQASAPAGKPYQPAKPTKKKAKAKANGAPAPKKTVLEVF